MTCGIYMIKNKDTGQIYIGQSINIERRFREHCQSKRKLYIDNAIRKHGKEKFIFSVICKLECDEDLLNTMEEYYIWKYDTYKSKNHYNLTPGGDFNPSKVPEIAEKISKSHMGKKLPQEVINKMVASRKGFKHSEETKKKLSLMNKGKKLSNEVKQKISEATMGMHRSPSTEFKKGEMSGANNPMYNKKHTKESRKKMSQSTKGKYIGKNNPKSKYTLWNNIKCQYNKNDMFKYKTEPRPRKVFVLKYNSKMIRIGGFLDFTTCELLYDLVDKEVNNVSS